MKRRVTKRNAQLAHWRTQKQLSQSEIAELLGISRKTYWNYEGGRSIPSAPVLLNLEQILDVPARTLYESFEDFRCYIPLNNDERRQYYV